MDSDLLVILLGIGAVLGTMVVLTITVMTLQNARSANAYKEDPNIVWQEVGRSQPDMRPDVSPTVFTGTDVSMRELGQPTTVGEMPRPIFGESGPQPQGCGSAVWGILIGAAMVAGAVVLGGYGFFNFDEYQSSEDWPTVEGTIVSTNIERQVDSEDDSVSYQVRITYDYSVDGETFRSDNIDFRLIPSSYSDRGDAEDVVATYCGAGRSSCREQPVEVIYNPDDPERSVLDRAYDEELVYGMMIGGVILAILGLAMVLYNLLRGFSSVLAPTSQTA